MGGLDAMRAVASNNNSNDAGVAGAQNQSNDVHPLNAYPTHCWWRHNMQLLEEI